MPFHNFKNMVIQHDNSKPKLPPGYQHEMANALKYSAAKARARAELTEDEKVAAEVLRGIDIVKPSYSKNNPPPLPTENPFAGVDKESSK